MDGESSIIVRTDADTEQLDTTTAEETPISHNQCVDVDTIDDIYVLDNELGILPRNAEFMDLKYKEFATIMLEFKNYSEYDQSWMHEKITQLYGLNLFKRLFTTPIRSIKSITELFDYYITNYHANLHKMHSAFIVYYIGILLKKLGMQHQYVGAFKYVCDTFITFNENYLHGNSDAHGLFAFLQGNSIDTHQFIINIANMYLTARLYLMQLYADKPRNAVMVSFNGNKIYTGIKDFTKYYGIKYNEICALTRISEVAIVYANNCDYINAKKMLEHICDLYRKIEKPTIEERLAFVYASSIIDLTGHENRLIMAFTYKKIYTTMHTAYMTHDVMYMEKCRITLEAEINACDILLTLPNIIHNTTA